jgi:SWI/SNF-related matrix-associated actin-dependent regulator of chromatin subfamily A3
LLASNTKSINALLVHLENLGHEEAPFVEGLNVELLPYQRQTLQWALDREQNPGGLQSFLWTKLPHVEDENVPDLYYNLLLQKITTEKPKLVRGGIIAEEMGLGKTVRRIELEFLKMLICP